MDMTNSFNAVFNFIINGMKWVFDTLDKVTFHGISLLDFFITLFVLGVAVPLVVSTVKSPRLPSGRFRPSRSSNESDDL